MKNTLIDRWLARRAFNALYWVCCCCTNSGYYNEMIKTLDILRYYMSKDRD